MQTWTCIYHFLSSCSADVLSAILKDISVSRYVALTMCKSTKHCSYTLSSPPSPSSPPLYPPLSSSSLFSLFFVSFLLSLSFLPLSLLSLISTLFLPLLPSSSSLSFLSPFLFLSPFTSPLPLPSPQPHCNNAKSTGLPGGGGSHADGGSPYAEAPGHLCHIFPPRGCHAPDEDTQRRPPQNASHAQTGNCHTPYHTFFHHLYNCC